MVELVFGILLLMILLALGSVGLLMIWLESDRRWMKQQEKITAKTNQLKQDAEERCFQNLSDYRAAVEREGVSLCEFVGAKELTLSDIAALLVEIEVPYDEKVSVLRALDIDSIATIVKYLRPDHFLEGESLLNSLDDDIRNEVRLRFPKRHSTPSSVGHEIIREVELEQEASSAKADRNDINDFPTVFADVAKTLAIDSLGSLQEGILKSRFLTLPEYTVALEAAKQNVEAFCGSQSSSQKEVDITPLYEAMFAYEGAKILWDLTIRTGGTQIKAAQAVAICASSAGHDGKYPEGLVESLVAAAVFKGEDPSCMTIQTAINALWGFAGMRLEGTRQAFGME